MMLFIKWIIGNPLVLSAVSLSFVVLIVMGSYGIGLKIGHNHEAVIQEQIRQAAIAKAIEQNRIAQEKASEQREKDIETTQKTEQDFKNAYSKTPDDKPSNVRNALSCARLRNQGYDVSKLPECIRP